MAAVACVTAEEAHGICREPKVLHDSALEPPALPGGYRSRHTTLERQTVPGGYRSRDPASGLFTYCVHSDVTKKHSSPNISIITIFR